MEWPGERMPAGARDNLLPRRCLIYSDVADGSCKRHSLLQTCDHVNHSLTDSLTPSTQQLRQEPRPHEKVQMVPPPGVHGK